MLPRALREVGIEWTWRRNTFSTPLTPTVYALQAATRGERQWGILSLNRRYVYIAAYSQEGLGCRGEATSQWVGSACFVSQPGRSLTKVQEHGSSGS